MALLKNKIRKNLSSEQREIARIKKYLANPMSQFIILGVIILLPIIVPASFINWFGRYSKCNW